MIINLLGSPPLWRVVFKLCNSFIVTNIKPSKRQGLSVYCDPTSNLTHLSNICGFVLPPVITVVHSFLRHGCCYGLIYVTMAKWRFEELESRSRSGGREIVIGSENLQQKIWMQLASDYERFTRNLKCLNLVNRACNDNSKQFFRVGISRLIR